LHALLFLTLLAAPAVPAQESDDGLEAEIEALKKGQENILKQLEELKRLVQAQQRAAAAPQQRAPAGPEVKDVVFDLANSPVKGDKGAKVAMLEFTDYQCPFCSRYAKDTYPQIAKEYVDTGKIRYALMDLPLETIHQLAFKAAEAARCAADQGKYWEMHDRLFENQRALEPWTGHAEGIGLDAAKFDTCMGAGTHAASIRAAMKEAQKVGIAGTPGFVIGQVDPKDPSKVKGLTFIRGAQPFPRFKEELDLALSSAN
jgi:protein-disulfide isomerase